QAPTYPALTSSSPSVARPLQTVLRSCTRRETPDVIVGEFRQDQSSRVPKEAARVVCLVCLLVPCGPGDLGRDVRFRLGLRPRLETCMIVLTVLVLILLFAYLLVALLRPEWF